MRHYIRTAKPDMITFDLYWFRPDRRPPTYRGSKDMAQGLRMYRNLALEGIDGSGAQPIQFGQFTQGYRVGPTFACTAQDYALKESQLRLYYYLTWTFGGRWQNWYRYLQGNDTGMGSRHVPCALLLQNGQPGMPTEVMAWTGKVNRESIHLGPHLVRRKTTDVRFVAGQAGATDGAPAGVARWDAGADPHLASISGTLLGSEQTGKQGDIFIGYFRVIPASEGGDPAFFRDPNASYFMLTNAFTSWQLTTAHETRQNVTLDLDLSGSPQRFLKEVDRETGQTRMAPLTPIAGGRHRLTIELPGGTGALYMATTSAD